MLAGTLAFITGIVILHRLPVLPEPWLPLLLALVAVPAPRAWRPLVLVFLLGMAWAAWDAREIPLPASLAGGEGVLEGHVQGLPETTPRRTRFIFLVDEAGEEEHELRPWQGRVRLSWYGEAPELRPGQRLRLTARLREPQGFSNPGGFDYTGWLYRHEIAATGYVRHGSVIVPEMTGLNGVRWWLARRLERALGERSHAGILQALALGDRRAMGDEAWSVLLATGTNHLVAISGLHVGLVAGLIYAVMRRIWGRWPVLVRCCPAPHGAALAGALAAIGYAALAGFSVPTQRALVMFLVGAGLLLSRRTSDPVRGLALAAWAVLGFDPRTVLESGFWLSFAAVVVILYGLRGRLRPRRAWRDGIRLQWWVSLGLVPLLLGLFGVASLSAPLANLFMVPLVGLLVVPLVLLGTALVVFSPDLASWPLALADGLLIGAWYPLEALAGLEGLRLRSAAVPVLVLASGALGLFWLHGPRGVPGRGVALALLVPVLAWLPARPDAGDVWLTALDVGEGKAVVVETRQHTLVYGAGPRFGVGFEAGGDLIAPYLRSRGIEHIDVLVLPRADAGLTGGTVGLTEAIPVRERIGAAEVERRDLPCSRAGTRDWDGVRLRFQPMAAGCRVTLATAGGGVVLRPGEQGLRRAGATRYRIDGRGLAVVWEYRREFRRHWH